MAKTGDGKERYIKSGSNRLTGLTARPKDTSVEEVRRVAEAERLGVTRGQLIEKMWDAYNDKY